MVRVEKDRGIIKKKKGERIMKGNKVFSRLDEIPSGMASKDITEGCMVLEGGAFRGNYTSGVMDALMENGINLSCTIGTSAGAMIGANYVAGHIGRAAKINLRFRHDKRYMGPSVFRRNKGIIGFDFILATYGGVDSTYPLNLARFFDPAKRFVAVTTNIKTGKPEYFEKGECTDIFRAIAASASMPMVSKPVSMDGQLYLDGGCADSIPFKWALNEGYEKIIVIKTRDDSYRKSDTETELKIKRGFFPFFSINALKRFESL